MKLHRIILALVVLAFIPGCASAPTPTAAITPSLPTPTSTPIQETNTPAPSPTATSRVRLPNALRFSATPEPTREIWDTPTLTLTSTPRPTSTPQVNTPAPLAGLAPISLTNYGKLRLVSRFYLEYAHLEEVNSFNPEVVFSPDSRYLAYLDGDRVVLWNIDAQRIERTFANKFQAEFPWGARVVFNPNGRLLASMTGEGPVVWNIDTGEILIQASAPIENMTYTDMRYLQDYTDLVFSADGRQIITGSFYAGTSVTFWDVQTGKIIRDSSATWNGIHDVDLSPDGKTIYTAVRSGLVNFFNAYTGERLEFPIESICWNAENCSESIGQVCYESIDEIETTPNGKILAVLCLPSDVEMVLDYCMDLSIQQSDNNNNKDSCYHTKLFNTETWKYLGSTSEFIPTLSDIVFNSDGGILVQAVGFPASQVKLWNTATREEIHTIQGFPIPIVQVAISPNGQFLLVRLKGGEVYLYGVDGS